MTKCVFQVTAGVIPGKPISEVARVWDITQEDLNNPPTFIDKSGAAMNYAMSLQNPAKFNWVKFEWTWF